MYVRIWREDGLDIQIIMSTIVHAEHYGCNVQKRTLTMSDKTYST